MVELSEKLVEAFQKAGVLNPDIEQIRRRATSLFVVEAVVENLDVLRPSAETAKGVRLSGYDIAHIAINCTVAQVLDIVRAAKAVIEQEVVRTQLQNALGALVEQAGAPKAAATGSTLPICKEVE